MKKLIKHYKELLETLTYTQEWPIKNKKVFVAKTKRLKCSIVDVRNDTNFLFKPKFAITAGSGYSIEALGQLDHKRNSFVLKAEVPKVVKHAVVFIPSLSIFIISLEKTLPPWWLVPLWIIAPVWFFITDRFQQKRLILKIEHELKAEGLIY